MSARDDVLGTDPRLQAPDFGLFAQREASPEAARPVARIELRSGRELAKPEADRTLSARQHKIVLALTAHGPLDRFRLHEVTGLSENSVNSACRPLLDAGIIVVHHYDIERKRGVLAIPTPDPGVTP